MKIYASKYKLDKFGYDSAGRYYGCKPYTQLYEVRIETEENQIGSSQVVRVNDYGYSNKSLRDKAIRLANLPELTKVLEK